MWGELLCARGEEELVVCAADDAACMWVDLEVYDLAWLVPRMFMRLCSCMRMGPSRVASMAYEWGL